MSKFELDPAELKGGTTPRPRLSHPNLVSPSREFMRSPFENVFQILPQGHDKALKQAFYSTASNAFALLAFAAAVAVYYILEPFLKPLLWAVLCGTFLFPFKCAITNISRSWLRRLQDRGTPLVLGCALIPVHVVDAASEGLGVLCWSNIHIVIGLCVAIPSLYLLVSFYPLLSLYNSATSMFLFLYNALGYFSALWVWTLVIGYVILLVWLWMPERTLLFKCLSLPVWLAASFHIAGIVGPLRVPLCICVVALLVTGFVSEIIQICSSTESEIENVTRTDTPGTPTPTLGFSERISSWITSRCSTSSATDETLADSQPTDGDSQHSATTTPTTPTGPASAKKAESVKQKKKAQEKSLSDYCFIGLFWAFVVIHMWIYNALFLVIPLLIAFLGIKRFGEYLGVGRWIKSKIKQCADKCQERLANDPRVDILLPQPVRRIGSWIMEGDSKILSTLDSSMDKIVSVLIIVLLLVGVVLVALFAALEIHRESMHLAHLSSDLLNKTSHPELTKWLPDEEVVQEHLDSVVNNAYVYGREWISDKLHGMLNGDEASKAKVEKQVLKIWDKLYVGWFSKNKTDEEGGGMKGGGIYNRQLSLDLSDFTNTSDMMLKFRQLDLDLVGFARENVEIFISLMKSVWAVLVNNVAMTVKILMSLLSLIFGSGSAIFNVFLSMIVFLTTLFYLLASSGNQYKPVELVVSLVPATQKGNDVSFGKAFEDAIGSVFLASLKMAGFYGLYTWLTHTLFSVQIIFIPSALAAIFAAVPFLGTYIAALPAVVELWLVHGQKLQALLLFVAHYLPTLFVDTAIYSEIKGGHPYLTGLAVAGGIFWLGLQGAIIGPILLCCLIVAVNMYQNLLKTDTVDTDKRPLTIGAASDKRVKFNLASKSVDVTTGANVAP